MRLLKAIPDTAPKKSFRRVMMASISREHPEMRWPAETSVRDTVRANPGIKRMMAESTTRGGFTGIPVAAVALARSPASIAATMVATGFQALWEEASWTIRKIRTEITAAAKALKGFAERRALKQAPVSSQEEMFERDE